MIDHVTISVRDLEGGKRWYEQALRPLGYSLVAEGEGVAGFAAGDAMADVWLAERGPNAPTHVALRSPDRETVDRFHEAAVGAGGTDNGPGLRAHYHENYYGAFVLDPEGNNVEAVCHTPE